MAKTWAQAQHEELGQKRLDMEQWSSEYQQPSFPAASCALPLTPASAGTTAALYSPSSFYLAPRLEQRTSKNENLNTQLNYELAI